MIITMIGYVQDAAKKHGVPEGFGSPFNAMQGPNGYACDLLGKGGPDRSALVNFIDREHGILYGRDLRA
jgi:hypothetical protein